MLLPFIMVVLKFYCHDVVWSVLYELNDDFRYLNLIILLCTKEFTTLNMTY